MLKENGVDAYFSGCLTSTLDSYKVDESKRDDNIYIVDPLYGYTTQRKVTSNNKIFIRSVLNGKIFELGKRKKHLKTFIDTDLLKSAIQINQEPPADTHSQKEKFEMAEYLLHKLTRAKLVITSRIHCALPCLAFGVPVIFINGFETFVDSCRFEGVIDLLNGIDVNTKTGEWKANFDLHGKLLNNTVVKNLEKHHDVAKALKKTCKDFIKNNNDK